MHFDLSALINLLPTPLNGVHQSLFRPGIVWRQWFFNPEALVCDVLMKLWRPDLIMITIAPYGAQCQPSSGPTSDSEVVDTAGVNGLVHDN